MTVFGSRGSGNKKHKIIKGGAWEALQKSVLKKVIYLFALSENFFNVFFIILCADLKNISFLKKKKHY